MSRDSPGTGRWVAFLPLATIAVSMLPFLLAPIRARELSPDGRGEFAYLQASFTIISTVGALGARHAYYALRGTGLPEQPLIGGRAVSSATIAALAVGAPLVAIGFLQHSLATTVLIAVVAFAGPVHLFVQLQIARAQFRRDDLRVALTTGIPALWEFFSNLALVLLNSMTVFLVSLMTISAEGFRALASVRNQTGSKSKAAQSDFNRFMWRFAVVGFMPMLVSNIDVVTYGALLPAAQLGYYAVAKLALTILVFTAVVLEGRFARAVRRFDRGSLVVVAALAAAALVGGILGTELIPPLFGKDYGPSASLFGGMAFVGFLGGTHLLLTARASALQAKNLALLSSSTVFVIAAVLSIAVAGFGSDIHRLAFPMGIGYAIGLAILIIGLSRPAPTDTE